MRSATAVAACIVILSVCGCATVTPEAKLAPVLAAMSYRGAHGSESFGEPRALVLAALHDSMNDLNLASIRGMRDGTVSRLEATTATKERVIATIRSHKNVTQVSIRVGFFGDEPLTRAIFERVEMRLGSRAPEGIPANPPSAPAQSLFRQGRHPGLRDAPRLRGCALS